MSKSRVALISGGTRGIGAAVTRRLADADYAVVAIYQSDSGAAAAVSAHPNVEVVQADIADPSSCRTLVDDIVADHGHLDIVVNNAGVLVEKPCADTSVDEWERVVAVNLSAAFHLCRLAVPPMKERRFGRIVNVSSVTAVMGSPAEAAYGAAKAGLHGLTRSLARETARHGITVNCVVPGVFDTDMTLSMPERTREAIARMIPVGRRGDPDELARAVAFLVADEAGYVTGSVLTVDGGLSMGG